MTKHSMDHPHSTSVQRTEYDDETKDMHITFAAGGKHRFKDVPKEVYDKLNASDSKGKHFHLHVRRKYDSEKVD